MTSFIDESFFLLLYPRTIRELPTFLSIISLNRGDGNNVELLTLDFGSAKNLVT